MSRTKKLAAVFAVCIAALNAYADPVVIEPDDFSAGTDISDAYDGITMSVQGLEVDSGNVATSVFSVNGSPSTGARVFGNFFDDIVFTQGWAQVARALRVDFRRPADSIAIDIIGRNNSVGEVQAFNAGGILVGTYQTAALVDLDLFETAFIDTRIPISYLLIGAVPSDNDFPTVRLDRLVYTPVPEPGTLALFGIGLFGMGFARRRKSRLR